MGLFSTTKEIETTIIEEETIEECQSDEVQVEPNIKVEEASTDEIKEVKPKRKRYYPKRPKSTDSKSTSGDKSKPKKPTQK